MPVGAVASAEAGTVSDIAGFLAARRGEDGARAAAASEDWDAEHARYEFEDLPDAVFAHVRSQDPARVLREVESDRKLLEWHHAELIDVINADGDERCGYWCAECDYEPFPCRTLRARVAIWSDHPDYDPGWRL
jgi:hypothetical protein